MTDRTSIRLSKQDGIYDMLLEDGKFSMATDGTSAACGMLERMMHFRDACEESPIVDTNKNPLAGMDWYGIVFQVNKTRAEKELELKRVILGTPGITSITAWQWTQAGRTVTITASVLTDWGEVDVSQTLEPL